MQKPNRPKKKPLQIYLTEDQQERLKIKAYTIGLSMNAYILDKLAKDINE